MISKLRLRFILLAALSLLLFVAFIVTGMNLINYRSVISEADAMLDLLAFNRGSFPENMPDISDMSDMYEMYETPENREPHMPSDHRMPMPMPERMTPETPYETRYFSVLLAADGSVIRCDTMMIASVDDETAAEYALSALEIDRSRGFVGSYRYNVTPDDRSDATLVTFLDCSKLLGASDDFLRSSVTMSLVGYVIIVVFLIFASHFILRPVAESYEKQKRFITDAGHEIKTPLAIISANVDLLEMEYGEDEATTDIRNQIKRLTGLTGELVELAKMEEVKSGRSSEAMEFSNFDLSDTVESSALPFTQLAAASDRVLTLDICRGITLDGNRASVARLIDILLDNALKYSPPQSIVTLKLTKSRLLSVTNVTETPLDDSDIAHIFDRFYRADRSRSSETGGHGIGLSLARSIAEAHGARISAAYDGGVFTVSVAW